MPAVVTCLGQLFCCSFVVCLAVQTVLWQASAAHNPYHVLASIFCHVISIGISICTVVTFSLFSLYAFFYHSQYNYLVNVIGLYACTNNNDKTTRYQGPIAQKFEGEKRASPRIDIKSHLSCREGLPEGLR
jgi:hypothetical protein